MIPIVAHPPCIDEGHLCIARDYEATFESGGMLVRVGPDGKPKSSNQAAADMDRVGAEIVGDASDFSQNVTLDGLSTLDLGQDRIYYAKVCWHLVCDYSWAQGRVGAPPSSKILYKFRVTGRSPEDLARAVSGMWLRLDDAKTIYLPLSALTINLPNFTATLCDPIHPQPGCPDTPRGERLRAQEAAAAQKTSAAHHP